MSAPPASLDESLVLAHQELGLQLLHGIECDANHDQDRGPAEVEGAVVATGGLAERQLAGEEWDDHRNRGQEQRPYQRDPRHDLVQVLGRAPARADAGYEDGLLLE